MLGNGKAVWIRTVSVMAIYLFVLNAENVKADFVFGEPVNLGPVVNTSSHDAALGITPDELTIYVDSNRSGGFDVWMTTRPSVFDPWGSPRKVESINTQYWDGTPSISADGLELYFGSDRPGGYGGQCDIWVARRETTNDPWQVPVNLGETINTSSLDWAPSISADGLELYFGSDCPGGYGNMDVWVTKRSTRDDEWGPPEWRSVKRMKEKGLP